MIGKAKTINPFNRKTRRSFGGKLTDGKATFGTLWDGVGMSRDVAVGTEVGTDWDEVAKDWDE